MKFLRDLLDKVEPLFTKGGKFERLYPLYEAGDTFLYTPGEVTKNGPHVRDSLDMKRMMSTVIVALIPCILMALYNTGYQAHLAIAQGTGTPIDDWREALFQGMGLSHDPGNVLACVVYGALWFLPIYIVTMVVGGTIEAIFSIVRGHEINEGFLVTGMLYPLTLPPTTPLLVVAAGIAFGVLIGKEVFGGTGKNFLNPALTARAFVYFAFARYLSGTTNPLGQGVWVAVNAEGVDGFTGATTLNVMVNVPPDTTPTAAMTDATSGLYNHAFDWTTAFLGFIQGSMGETSTLCCLLGAVLLIATGIGSWRIMAGVTLGALVTGAICHYGFPGDNPVAAIPPWWHLVIGGFAFGTVFMATDPVSASMTETGKWWYGALIGVLTILIRVTNPAYAEGIMLAILFGNVMAPTIDYMVIQANIKRRLARYGT